MKTFFALLAALSLALTADAAATNTISALTATTNVSANDLLETSRSNSGPAYVSRKITVQNLLASLHALGVITTNDTREVKLTALRIPDGGKALLEGSGDDSSWHEYVDGDDIVFSNLTSSVVIRFTSAGGITATLNGTTISTTLGQTWSRNNTVAKMTDGDMLKVAPLSYRKKVLVFGSSVALGSGATSDQGWAFQLGAVLTNRGFLFRNHSISGDTTSALLARFYTDVAPEKPDYVIIALSLFNEGITGTNAEAVATTYITNMHRLVSMCRQAGAVPIVAGCYPNSNYTAVEYEYIRQFNDQMEAEGVMTLNFLGATDDGTGKWISSLQADASHPNDAGHAEMFYSIPPTLFETMQDYADNLRPSQGGGVLFNTNASGYAKPLDLLPVQTFSSFSVAVRVRASQSGLHHAILGVGSGIARVRAPSAVLTYSSQAGEDISSAVSLNDLLWHQIVISYSHARSWMDFYIDGALIGGTNESFGGALVTNICFLGRQDGAANAFWLEFKDALIYRTTLTSNQVRQIYSGYYPRAALELYAPLSDKSFAANRRLVNLAPTASYLQVSTTAAPVLLPVDAGVYFGDVRGRMLSGDGSGLTALPASSLAGTIADARLSTNVLVKSATNDVVRLAFTNSALTAPNSIRAVNIASNGIGLDVGTGHFEFQTNGYLTTPVLFAANYTFLDINGMSAGTASRCTYGFGSPATGGAIPLWLISGKRSLTLTNGSILLCIDQTGGTPSFAFTNGFVSYTNFPEFTLIQSGTNSVRLNSFSNWLAGSLTLGTTLTATNGQYLVNVGTAAALSNIISTDITTNVVWRGLYKYAERTIATNSNSGYQEWTNGNWHAFSP